MRLCIRGWLLSYAYLSCLPTHPKSSHESTTTKNSNKNEQLLQWDSTWVQRNAVFKHEESSKGIDSNGSSIFQRHTLVYFVPHTLILHNVCLPCPCTRKKNSKVRKEVHLKHWNLRSRNFQCTFSQQNVLSHSLNKSEFHEKISYVSPKTQLLPELQRIVHELFPNWWI